ncbi:Na/Pi cotransporter family protein [Bosea sp. (in: a-proteobacteria)]|jgi:phosphate:Na+ symporter|uniref:Na/Pi cotransporter family protein n=1 Tax=Bosea sp. (in: a-proteobacteria) TaxID=1871050 RepID=UPI003F6EA233
MNAVDSTTSVLIHLAGSVALLIWAVRLVRTGATRAFGSSLRQALSRFTQNRVAALASGAAVTLVLQSSTATTLLLSSFAGQSLITLPMALAVLLGANIGTALAAFIVSLDLGWIWGLCLAVGVALYMANEAMDRARNIGRVFVGIGLILLSLVELKAAAAPLAQSPTFKVILQALAGEPLIAVAVAVAATWLTHSSLAIVLLIASFWSGGLLSPTMAVTLIVGANLGNALVPVVDQLGAPVAQRRVAVANLLTRVVIAVVVIPLAAPFAAWFSTLSNNPARLAVELHLALNIAGGLIFLPFVTPLSELVMRLMPSAPVGERATRPLYLDPGVLDSPSEALACAMRETLHLGDRVGEMLKDTLTLLDGDQIKLSREISQADDGVDAIHEAIKLYLVRLSRSELSEEESRRLLEIITLNTNLEHIGDIIDKNLRELAEKKIRKGYRFSAEGLAEISALHSRVMHSLRLALNVLATRDIALARQLFDEKATMRSAERQATESHYERLRSGVTESIETSSIHLDVLRDLKRIHGHITSIAYPILEAAGELRESRLRNRENPAPEAGFGLDLVPHPKS